MSTDRIRVVVTGLGAFTPLGGDVASTWSAMLAGTSGVRRMTDGWPYELPVKIAAPAAVDPESVIHWYRRDGSDVWNYPPDCRGECWSNGRANTREGEVDL